MDLSLGNPRSAFKALLREAFAQTLASAAEGGYRTSNPYMSTADSVREFYHPIAETMKARLGLGGLATDHLLMGGGGSTENFDLLMQVLAKDVAKENALRPARYRVKPAILMPVPTYGMFFDNARRAGIEIVPVMRDMNRGGSLTRDALTAAMRKAHRKGLRIVAFYDSNPNNPTGLVRDEAQTREIGEILQVASYYYNHKLDERRGARKPPWRWVGPASRIRMIDDMAYAGLEYGGKKAFSFAQVPEFFDDTVALFSLSKAGAVGLRAGLAIGNEAILKEMRYLQRERSYFPNTTALYGLSIYFNDKGAFARVRNAHLRRMNKANRFAGILMKTLINGLAGTPEATPDDAMRMTKALMRHAKMNETQAQARLGRGIDGVRVISTPESGFFHLLDVKALAGRYYPSRIARKQYTGWVKGKADGFTIEHVFGGGGDLHFAHGDWAGLPEKQMILRATFALPLPQIIEAVNRMEAAVAKTVSSKTKPSMARLWAAS